MQPDKTRKKTIPYQDKFVFTEFTKHPEVNIETKHLTIKEKEENHTSKISNVRNEGVSYFPIPNEGGTDEKSPTSSLGDKNSKEKNLSFNSPNILQEYPEHFSDESKEVKPQENLLPTNLEKQEEKINHGRWTKEEQIRFIEALWFYGNEWKKVQLHIGTRSSSQSRSHAQKFFLKLKNKLTTHRIIKGNENITEENFRSIIDWISESLETRNFFLNSKNVFYF